MQPYGRGLIIFAGSVALVAATSCAPRAERRATPASGALGGECHGAVLSDDPLQTGWQFACAITNDADDRAECQAKIAMAHLARGAGDTAVLLGERIENWRKGVVLAEAAAFLAEGGQTNAALERAAQAEAIGRGIQDWQRDRILSRVAKTKALLGMEAAVGKQSAFYLSNLEYHGEVAAYHALALARGGQMTNALAVLDGLADATHLDVSSWRANGYMQLAKAGQLDGMQTSNALAQAWSASDQVPGTKRPVVQMGLVEQAAVLGAQKLARTWLDGISTNILAATISAHIKAPLVAQLAVCRGLLGQQESIRECELVTEPLIRQLQGIEQPALFALLGEAWARGGDRQKGLDYYEHALELAGKLINPRPRAIACVEICLSLDRSGLRHRSVSEGLNRLLADFGVPHG
jgi:tetratricopeptide (TPR) repeat protein